MTTGSPLAGRTMLVLGATGQVGGLVAGELLARGARVVAASRRPERLEELASALRRAGYDDTELAPVVGDLGDEPAAAALRDAVLAAAGGRLDGVVAAPVSTAVAAQRMLDAALELETRGRGVVVEELVFSGSARRPGWVDGEQLVDRVTQLVAGVPSPAAS